jgi:pilus assembly protein Flp/PilA
VKPASSVFGALGQWLSVRHCPKDPAGLAQVTENEHMRTKDKLLKFSAMLQILKNENGQDLVEYAFVVVLIASAATASMSAVAKDINIAFANMGGKISGYTN